MKGTILDYTTSEAFILLDDDSIVTVPLTNITHNVPIGSNVNITNLHNGTYSMDYKPHNFYDKSVDLF